MNERMGNGAIQINITLYPDVQGPARYDKCISRAISLDHLGDLPELRRLANSTGELVASVVCAMVDTLQARAEMEAIQVKQEEVNPGWDEAAAVDGGTQ